MTTEPMCRRCGKNPIFDISDGLCESCCFEVDVYRDGELVSRTETHFDGSQRVQSWADSLTEMTWDDDLRRKYKG